MPHNFLVLFIRNFRRQTMFSTINLLGLTVSIVSTTLIYLYVSHEFSFDAFHKNADRIYRVNQTFIWGENDNHQFASTGPGVATALKEELSEIELMTSLWTPGNSIITYKNKEGTLTSFEEEKVLAADTNFFRVFNFPMATGDPRSALRQAQTLVMTKSTAKKYFGEEDAVGKLVLVGGGDTRRTFEVTGVVEDVPDNSYIQFDILLSMTSFPQVGRLYWSWVWTQLETYILLADKTNISETRTRLAKIPEKHAEETLRRVMNVTYAEYIKSGKKWELFLQPLTDIHLPREMVYNRISNSGNITIIYSLIGAAIFIVLLSCINFMNLSAAQFIKRVKEASIRKILGISRLGLAINFFLEALIFCFIALLVGLAAVQFVLPGFNLISGKQLELNLLGDPTMMGSTILLGLLMALVSGIYPAIFLSAFHPVEAMKGKLRVGQEGKSFRNGLVVFQFTASIVLIICTALVFQQLNYVSEKDLGFDKNNLLVLKHVENVTDGKGLAEATLDVPGVKSATWCTSLPPTVWGGDKFTAAGMSDKTFSLNYTTSDERFVPTLELKILIGRNFLADNLADSSRVILNETAIRRIGWSLDESVVGKKISSPGGDTQFEVVGVVSDFNYWSLQSNIEPMGIFHIKSSEVVGEGGKKFIAIRVGGQNSESWNTTLSELQSLWKKHAGDTPFEYSFVDQAFSETFRTEEQFGKALIVMAGLAILIASLGLLGMIIYTLQQRTKEIGIRKVSGASAWNIMTLITRSYAQLIIIAFFIAAPLSYWIMVQWLQEFAFRIKPSPAVFILAGIGTMMTAMLITAYHAVKSARMNPVDVLKDE